MDRRTMLTGAAAALLGAVGVGRVLTHGGASPERPQRYAPRGTSADAGATPAPSPTPAPASPAPSPAPEPSPASAIVVPVICRDAWGARPPGPGLVDHRLRRMTVHHTAVPLTDDADAPGRLRQHQRFHQEQGWPDIAYHLGVDRRGNRYELRTSTAQSDTFTDYDPTGHLSLLAEGDFNRQQPTDAQLEALAQLLAWGVTAHGLPLESIAGHRDHASTACPGDALYARLPDLRRRAAELAAAGVELRSVCGEEGRTAVARIEAGAGDG